MRLLPKNWFEGISSFFSKLPFFSRPDKNSLHFLNISQFMGVLNDNIFKFVIAYLLIDIKGPEHAGTIVSLAGIIFVLPFLLFSSTAGVLADRFSKQRLMMIIKSIEVLTMILAMFAFSHQSVWASYSLLFLLSTHSAMFGPAKYAIISELVPHEKVSWANGLITSFTYLAVIVGTFLASFVTEMTDRNYVLVAAFCLAVAVIGFIATFGIKRTLPQSTEQKHHFLFIKEIYETLQFCRSRKHLLLAVCGSAYFLFIGSFTQLNIIPFALSSLHLSEISGGYLFLSTALGIAIGSYLGGKVSKKRVELGLSCFSGLFVALFLLLLWVFSSHLITVIILLVLLGIFGGFFIVPFDAFIQIFSPNEKRGQIIAANNFLSFFGVLLSSIVLFIYSTLLDLSPAKGFAVTGVMTFIISILMISRLSDLALPFFARHVLYPFNHVKAENLQLLEKNPQAILILQKASWKKAFLLLTVAPEAHLLAPRGKKNRFPWFDWAFYSIKLVRSDGTLRPLLEKAKTMSEGSLNPCIMVESRALPESLSSSSNLLDIFKSKATQFIYVDITCEPKGTLIALSEKPFFKDE